MLDAFSFPSIPTARLDACKVPYYFCLFGQLCIAWATLVYERYAFEHIPIVHKRHILGTEDLALFSFSDSVCMAAKQGAADNLATIEHHCMCMR